MLLSSVAEMSGLNKLLHYCSKKTSSKKHQCLVLTVYCLSWCVFSIHVLPAFSEFAKSTLDLLSIHELVTPTTVPSNAQMTPLERAKRLFEESFEDDDPMFSEPAAQPLTKPVPRDVRSDVHETVAPRPTVSEPAAQPLTKPVPRDVRSDVHETVAPRPTVPSHLHIMTPLEKAKRLFEESLKEDL
jgi:hypothetical protein